MIHSEIFVKRHCSHPLTPAPLIRRAHERGQQAVISALLAQMNVVTLPQPAAEVDGPLLNHGQQMNAPVTTSMRWELFAHNLTNTERVRADDAVLAELSKGLSGGDILNLCVNAIHAGSVDPNPAKWVVTQGMIEREIWKVRKAKAGHSGGRQVPKGRIGFQSG